MSKLHDFGSKQNLQEEIERLAGKGMPVGVDREMADFMAAFEEDALGVEDALESSLSDTQEH